MAEVEILQLAQRGDVHKLRSLREQGELSGYPIQWNQCYYPKSGDTVMHVAARCGHKYILRFLHDECSGVDWEQGNLDGKRPLHEAAQSGQLECLQLLLSYNVNVNVLKKADWTPLMLACTKNVLCIIKLLVEAKADLMTRNKDGWTAFHIACREGDVSIVSYLLDCKPEIWKTSSKNRRTSLHTAALHGRGGVVEVLLRRCEYPPDEADSCGSTPFMDAVRADGIHIAELLIDLQNVNILAQDKLGRQPLHLAAQVGSTESIEYLINGLNVDVNSLTTSSQTPLHLACKEGQLTATTQLVNLGADIGHTDNHGRTALDLAKAGKHMDCINVLLSR